MPTRPRREDAIIERFVSAYQECAWKESRIDWLDRTTDGAVDALVTRQDGTTLAIEHTLIEPFVGDRQDFERSKIFQSIERDPALRQVDRVVSVDVPRGALPMGEARSAIVTCMQRWLRSNLPQLAEGSGCQECAVEGHGITKPFVMNLYIKIIRSKGFVGGPLIRRWGETNVEATVEKALNAKLPKLVATPADVRILLLERNQWSLSEARVWQEIQRRAPDFPRLGEIDEVWFAETVFYDVPSDPNWCGYLAFTRYAGAEARVVANMAFMRGESISSP